MVVSKTERAARYRKRHPERVNATQKNYLKRHPEKHLQFLRARYNKKLQELGTSLEEFEEIVRNQGGQCAICKSSDRVLCADHDHRSGQIRGVICKRCNSAIGLLGDDPVVAANAALYLRSGVKKRGAKKG